MSNADNDRLHRRLTLNSASNMGRYVLSIGITFFLTPYILERLGDSQYGFWVLLVSFIGYASILEMGVQPAVVKLVGQYKGVGDFDKLNEMLTAAFAFFLTVGIVAGTLGVTVAPAIVQQHVDDLQSLSNSQWLFPAIALDAMIMYMNYLFSGILYGWQRYHAKNVVDTIGWLLNAALIVVLLESQGLLAMVAAKLAMDFFVLISCISLVRRVYPGLRFDFRALRRDSFRTLIGFGGRVFLSATTTRIATHAQPLIISTAVSSAATAFYAIPVKLIDYGRQIAWTLTTSFMPMFSELESRNERSRMRSIYLGYSRYIFMGMLIIVIMLAVYGADFIGLWIGPEYQERGSGVLFFLVAALFIESAQPLLWRFFIGVGELDVLVKVSATVSLLVVASSLVLVRFFGIDGVAAGVLLGAVVAQGLYAVHSCRYLEMSVTSLFTEVHLRPLVAGGITLVLAELAAHALGTGSYLQVFASAFPAGITYVVLCYALGLTRSERSFLRQRLGKLRKAAA